MHARRQGAITAPMAPAVSGSPRLGYHGSVTTTTNLLTPDSALHSIYRCRRQQLAPKQCQEHGKAESPGAEGPPRCRVGLQCAAAGARGRMRRSGGAGPKRGAGLACGQRACSCEGMHTQVNPGARCLGGGREARWARRTTRLLYSGCWGVRCIAAIDQATGRPLGERHAAAATAGLRRRGGCEKAP